MALYKRSSELTATLSEAFDREHEPGRTVPHSGIYCCLGCRREIARNAGTVFPPLNHHQHPPGQGTIRWRLSVYAEGNPK